MIPLILPVPTGTIHSYYNIIDSLPCAYFMQLFLMVSEVIWGMCLTSGQDGSIGKHAQLLAQHQNFN